MKMIVTWLLGVPVTVAFFFAVFAVDASKLAPPSEQLKATQAVATAPVEALTRFEKLQSDARVN